MSIIINDLDPLLIGLCDLISDYYNLMYTNKHYHKLITSNKLFIEWNKIHTEKYYFLLTNIGLWNNLFSISCSLGLLLFSKYLVYKYDIDIHFYREGPFHLCCQNGHLDVAKWLVELSSKKDSQLLDIHGYNNSIYDDGEHGQYEQWTVLEACCDQGHIDVAKWLIDLSRKPEFTLINIHANNDRAFIRSCRQGHLNIAKWLIDLSRQADFTLIDIHSGGEEAFIESCSEGHLDVAKWLINLSREPGFTLIDIHTWNEDAFTFSCLGGYLDVAKWLIDLSREPGFTLIDIHVWNDDAFIQSCQEEHFEVAKWLIDLSHEPDFTPISDDIIAKYYHPK